MSVSPEPTPVPPAVAARAANQPADQTQPADQIATATLAVPGVVGLHSGSYGQVATYLRGRKVDGIRIGDQVAEVHVVLDYAAPLRETADLIRAAVESLTGTPVDVTIEDLGPDDSAVPSPADPDLVRDGS